MPALYAATGYCKHGIGRARCPQLAIYVLACACANNQKQPLDPELLKVCAETMVSFANSCKVKRPLETMDIVGTGGDGLDTFNVSTAAGMVLAAAGVKCAKHGNRSASGSVGSADFLEALGCNIKLNGEQVATAVDGKLNKTVRRMQEDNAALRKETHDLLAELEQLTLQMYEEHEAALTACREAQAAQRSGLEGLGETQRATFDAQQAQIDALGAVVRKQQGMIDELTSASAVQMASAQAEVAELSRAFSAQAAAVEASRAHAAALEASFSAELEKRVNTSELLQQQHLETLAAKVEQQG